MQPFVHVADECISLQRLGVNQMKFDAVDGEAKSERKRLSGPPLPPELAGTILEHRPVLFTMSSKYTKGSCRAAYCPVPVSPRKQFPGEQWDPQLEGYSSMSDVQANTVFSKSTPR